MSLKKLLLVGTLTAASGCYTYLPAPPSGVSPGTPVRIRLTADQAEAFVPQRLTADRDLDGTLLERTDGSLLVETPVGRNDAERGMSSLMQKLTVPEGGIVEIEQRTLNKGRTGLVMAGAAVVAGVVLTLRSQGGRGGPDQPPGGGNQEARRVPVLRIRLPH